MENLDWLFMFNLMEILKLQQRFRLGGWALGGLQGHFTLNNLLPEILQRNLFKLGGANTQHPLFLLKRRKTLPQVLQKNIGVFSFLSQFAHVG